MTKCQKDPRCGIFLKRGLFKDIKYYIPKCQTHKHKNINTKYTNTQIQHMTKCQKDPTCGIFLKKKSIVQGYQNYIPIQYKLEHLSFAQLYEVQSYSTPLYSLLLVSLLFSFNIKMRSHLFFCHSWSSGPEALHLAIRTRPLFFKQCFNGPCLLQQELVCSRKPILFKFYSALVLLCKYSNRE